MTRRREQYAQRATLDALAKRPAIRRGRGHQERAQAALLLAAALISGVHSHGYLSSPRARNLVASEDKVWCVIRSADSDALADGMLASVKTSLTLNRTTRWPITEDDPQPETCPHCLNRGMVARSSRQIVVMLFHSHSLQCDKVERWRDAASLGMVLVRATTTAPRTPWAGRCQRMSRPNGYRDKRWC